MDWMQLISSVGFPIVACLGMGWYVKYETDNNRSEIKDLQREHKAEIDKITDALNNNTLALNLLSDKLDGGVNNGKGK